MRILVIDDDAFDRTMLHRSLRDLVTGLLIDEAGGVEAGRARFRDHLPDMVIVDVNMPGGNGFEFVRWVRQVAARMVPVLMLSGSTDPHDRAEALAAGADAYLVKPASLTGYRDLACTVREWMWSEGDGPGGGAA